MLYLLKLRMLIYFTNFFFLILFLAEGQNRKYSFFYCNTITITEKCK